MQVSQASYKVNEAAKRLSMAEKNLEKADENLGPTLIIRKKYDLDTKLSELPARSSYDEVVAFIDQMLDEAMPGLSLIHI